MADSHKKKTAKEAISNEQEAKGKYSPSELRKNMSTGGGEPIKAGKKWTTEHRVLQPRDPDTGHFTYNADAQLGLKYKQRAKGAIPVGAKGWILNGGIKKGDKVVTDDSVWVAIEGIDKQKLINYFKKYDEAEGEYYIEEDGKATGLSSEFVGKRGRKSKEEKEAIEKAAKEKDAIASEEALGYKYGTKQSADKYKEKQDYMANVENDTWKIAGNVDVSSLGKYSQEEMKQKFDEKQKGFEKNKQLTQIPASIGIQKRMANQAYNQAVQNRGRTAPLSNQTIQKTTSQLAQNTAGQPAQTGTVRTPTVVQNGNIRPQKNVGQRGGTIPFNKGMAPDADSIKKALENFRKNK